ncbi:hypothetical protein A3K72_00665 [Candidatus Woesearchaeota archaeon RBG_13_36_6]|nr:MAG: hypothetical protein A3K72_00665 [Candidatus Woesearchaeota archaeon RBG_13_36_6]
MDTRLRKILIFLSSLIGFAFSLILFITFVYAFFFNDFYFCALINLYGEALLELVLFIILIPFLLFGLYLNYIEIKNFEKH